MHVEACTHAYVCICLCVLLSRRGIARSTRDCVNVNLYLEDHLLSFHIATILLPTAMAEGILSPPSPSCFSQPMGLHVGMAPGVAAGRQTPPFERAEKIGNSQTRLFSDSFHSVWSLTDLTIGQADAILLPVCLSGSN